MSGNDGWQRAVVQWSRLTLVCTVYNRDNMSSLWLFLSSLDSKGGESVCPYVQVALQSASAADVAISFDAWNDASVECKIQEYKRKRQSTSSTTYVRMR